MEESQSQLWYVFLAICTLSGLALLPVPVRSLRSPILYLPIVSLALYFCYETLLRTSYPHVDIRIDVFVLWPLLFVSLKKSWRRWSRLRKASRREHSD